MISIAFSISSIIIITILIIVYFFKERIKTEETTIFSNILICTYIGLFLELLSFILLKAGHDDNSLWFIVVSKIILVYFYVWASLFSMYINVSANSSKLNKLYNYSIPIGSIILLILPIDFIKENGMVIPGGLASKFVYFTIGFFIALSLFKMFTCKEKNWKKFVPLISFIIFMTISTIIQYYNPSFIFTDIIFATIIYIMFFTIENPDVKMLEQMELAKDQAEKANRAKTDFLSSMSHEIRTPLNAIVGFSDCIMEAKDLGEAKENAKDIVNASQTLLEIVNGILDISKIEAGKLEIVNSKYNALETFEELAKLITPKMHEKGLDFTYSIAPDLPTTLYGDHANLKKIVTNLLSNACKYTEHGYVHYEVNCVNTNDVSKLIISVEDSGRGIKKDDVDKLFTKFQRLDEDRNTTIEGTGLGLAITKQLIELMGGKIILHTVYGEGSKFTVVLNQKIETAEVEEKKRVKSTLDLRDVRILLVDDTPLNLKVASKLLEKYNANQVVTCDSGFECIERIDRGEIYDLILLDDMMPRMSGVETLKKLKENPNFNIPTIALTANAITGMREKYLADGFDDFLAKPIEKDQLIQVVNQILGRSITEEINIQEVRSKTPSPAIRSEVVNVENLEKNPKPDIIPVEEDVQEMLGEKVERNYHEKDTLLDETPIPVDVIEGINPNPEVDLVPVVDINTPEVKTEGYDRTFLEKKGVDVNHALELLGDMEMYNMTISDFMKEVEDKWSRIVEYRDNNNMPDYAIEVHSLKSDCKYLGFMKLADIAYQHELKSKENDLFFVQDHFAELEEEYKKVLEIAKEYVEHNPVSDE